MSNRGFIRKIVWAAVVALSVMAARRLAAALWRRTLHEEPPARS